MSYTDNVIPQMTSSSAPSGVAFSGGDYAPGWAAWQAFDHNPGTDGNFNTWLAPGGEVASIGYQFPSARIISRYAIADASACAWAKPPKSWAFQGSNDGSTWDTLDAQTNVTDWALSSGVRKVFDFINATPYIYNRLDITASNGGQIIVGELEMMETVLGRWFRRRGRNGQHDRFYRMKG